MMRPDLLCMLLQRNMQFFEDLANPDVDGSWLLPKLVSIKLDNQEVGLKLLMILTRVITNRLESSATEPIHSLSLRCCFRVSEPTIRPYVDSLTLLFPSQISQTSTATGFFAVKPKETFIESRSFIYGW